MDTISRMIDRAVEIQQIPAPTFGELQRAKFLHQAFLQEGLTRVETDGMGNVFACLPGRSSGISLVVSAHTDTVFPQETDLSIRRNSKRIYGPGIGDNALGVAGLFGLIWELEQGGIELPGDVWLVANIAEEGLGDLVGMKAVVKRFGNTPLGYIVLEGLGFGRIYQRGLGVHRYRISVETAGGHSWVDFGSPSAIHELSGLISQILALRLPTRNRTSMNVGKIAGGVSLNTIAPTARLELDLRSENQRSLTSLCRKVEDLVRLAERPGVHFEIELIGNRPFGQIDPAHPLVQLAIRALALQGHEADLLIGSTDANVPLSQKIPSICIGLSNGGGAHTIDEYMDLEPLPRGVAQLVEIVRGAFELNL